LKDALNKSKAKNFNRNITDKNEKNQPPRHSALLPNTIRALNVGPSNLIESPNGLKFE